MASTLVAMASNLLASCYYVSHQSSMAQHPVFLRTAKLSQVTQRGMLLLGSWAVAFASKTVVGPPPTAKIVSTPGTNESLRCILEAKGGAKASAPEWESGGQRGRKKHGALFGGRGEESFICGSLPGSSCERRERRETERRETERRERERERRER